MARAARKRVLIADDHALLAEGMANLLSDEYDIVGISRNGRQLVADASQHRPDLIVLDISMPELNGIEAAKKICATVPGIKIVFVTQQIDPQYLRAALQAGAVGYVAKQSASEELRMALRYTLAGQTFITPLLQDKTGYAPVAQLRTDGATMTPRQREVLQLIAEGKTTKEISSALNISSKTVEFHKKAIMDQTGLRTTAELTRYAIANGVITL